MSDVPEIHVICAHRPLRGCPRPGRSLRARGGRCGSAGSAPVEKIDSAMAQVLIKQGLDVSKEAPRGAHDDAGRSADVIITMGCGDARPVYSGKRYLHWDVIERSGKPTKEVPSIVDDIERRVLALLE